MSRTEYTTEEIVKIIDTLVGNIMPQGESRRDGYALHNLKVLCGVVGELVSQIDNVAWRNEDAYEDSRIDAAKYAKNFLINTLGIN